MLTLCPLWARADIEIILQEQPPPATSALSDALRLELGRLPQAAASLDVRISVGPAGFRRALAAPDSSPIIATFLTSTDFSNALGGRAAPPHVTAVFSNPNPSDQVHLAKLILGAPRLGSIESPSVRALSDTLKAQGVISIPFSAAQDVDSILRSATEMDAIVALPDPSVLNQANIAHIVRTLYTRRKVLIGYSDTLTRVGSLASVYVTPDAIAKEVSRSVQRLADTGALPSPSFVPDIEVSVNEQLARSLNLVVPPATSLRTVIRSERNERAP